MKMEIAGGAHKRLSTPPSVLDARHVGLDLATRQDGKRPQRRKSFSARLHHLMLSRSLAIQIQTVSPFPLLRQQPSASCATKRAGRRSPGSDQ
jgi:hypothetical protein